MPLHSWLWSQTALEVFGRNSLHSSFPLLCRIGRWIPFVIEEKGREYRRHSRTSQALYAVMSGWQVMHTKNSFAVCAEVCFSAVNVWNIWYVVFHLSAGKFAFSSLSFPSILTMAWWRNCLQSVLKFSAGHLFLPWQLIYPLHSICKRKRELHPGISMGCIFFGALVCDHLHCRLETLFIHCILCQHQCWDKRK